MRQQRQLWLTFGIGERLFGLCAEHVLEVIPFVTLRAPPAGMPDWMRGVADYHGTLLPVADLSRMAGAPPACDFLSTRIFIVHPPDQPEKMAGLLAERATDTQWVAAKARPVATDNDLPAWTTSLTSDTGIPLALVHLEQLPLFVDWNPIRKGVSGS
ncbi:MAG TPA: hypothetical protein DCS43_01880 [Verrucomicrobia bacterium]|nr:hypothetical protein [Verrucomicrobiota bacterium]